MRILLTFLFTLTLAAQQYPPHEATIGDMQSAMTQGKITSRALVEQHLQRIAEIDKAGPKLNSIIELNPDALAIADERDAERKAGRTRGPLHGIPIVIKDNIDTADRMHTTAGSLALENNIATRDAHIVRRLREAGAVIIGKTNLSEWANFRSMRAASGWSGRGGLTRNPYALHRNACGSSSGSGVAVAAGLTAAAVGTETDGSIVCPATTNGIVGLKPTLGLVSRSGIIPIAHSQDTAGPMARTVTDAAILLGAMTGIDSLDAETLASRNHVEADYTKFLDANALQGKRIGVLSSAGFSDQVGQVMKAAVESLKKLGATTVDIETLTKEDFGAAEFEVLLYEFKADLNAYLATTPAAVKHRTLADLIRFNEENREREMPYFGQEIFLEAEKKGPLTDAAYRSALAKSKRIAQRAIDGTLKKHNLDAIVAPTGGPSWTTDLVNGDHYTGGNSSASAVSGYPHITVPAGYVHGLPVGLSFLGAAWTDAELLGYAYAFEQATKARQAPTFAAELP